MKLYNNISFSGGSNKGFAYLGVLKAFEKIPEIRNIKNISGASIGSFFATLFCMDFYFSDLINFVNISFDFNDMEIDNLFDKYGFSTGKDIINIFKEIISKKYNPEITFKELYKKTKKNLFISASSLTKCNIKYFSHKTNPNMKIITAIRLSISIPYIFTSEKYNGEYFIDGAIFEKLPIRCFHNNNTLGVNLLNKLDTIEEQIPNEINSIEDYTLNILLLCRKKINEEINIDLININTIDINPIKFDLDNAEKLELIKSGYRDTIKFINLNIK